MAPPRTFILVLAAVGLFLVWSNTFIAVSYLLGGDRAAARFDWVALTVARFLPAAILCGAYCFALHARESIYVIRRHGQRLLLAALMAVPGYNLALYFGQQHGVPAPIASLTTTLLPLFVMIMAALFLGERLTARRIGGFLIATGGMTVVALARPSEARAGYAALIAITALAPLCWSLYTVLSKPVMGKVRPLLWTYLAITAGGVLLIPLIPHAWSQCAALDASGWLALAYLTLPATVLGFAVWTWLLEHLPASAVGFAVFLNPPLTTLSKLVLATFVPATFVFVIAYHELLGGAVALLGLLVATWQSSTAAK